MAKLRSPPSAAELARIPPVVRTLRGGTRLWRVYFRGGPHPAAWHSFRRFGPTPNRFDHHLPDSSGQPCTQHRGILYAAANPRTCLAEIYQDSRVIQVNRRAPWLVCFDLATDLSLLDLSGVWPTRTGRASMAINTGRRDVARAWSRMIYEAYPHLHGLYYSSSMHANAPSVALYERATGSLPPRPHRQWALSDPRIFPRIQAAADYLGYGVA